METLVSLLKMAAILGGGLLLGHAYFQEVKKAKRIGAPWYAPYKTAPGILVLVALMLPLFVWICSRLR